MIKFLKSIDLILLSVIGLYGLTASVFDLFDIHTKWDLFNGKSLTLLSVLILSVICIHLVVDYFLRDSRHSEIIENDLNIIKSLDGVVIKQFENAEEMEEYLSTAILAAKSEVCDLSWKNALSLSYSTTPRQRSMKKLNASIKKVSRDVTYREVYVFNDGRRIDKFIEKIEQNLPGYSCRYYDEENSNIPRLQFVIIDKSEIVFASSTYPQVFSLKHDKIVENFQFYFDQIWSAAIPLKEGTVLIQENIDKVLANKK